MKSGDHPPLKGVSLAIRSARFSALEAKPAPNEAPGPPTAALNFEEVTPMISRATQLAVLLAGCQTQTTTTNDAWTLDRYSRRDDLIVIVQVCVPDKFVAFEDVEVDLTRYPKAQTLLQARRANHADVSMLDGWARRLLKESLILTTSQYAVVSRERESIKQVLRLI